MPGFVFTDIQGSTTLWDRLGSAFHGVLAEHNRIVREELAAAGGRELRSEGDGFALEFTAAAPAVSFALRVQERLHAVSWPEEVGELFVRIGVHAGDGPADESLAGCIAQAAHGGQILLSEATAAASPAGADLRPLGVHWLKGHERPVRLVQALPASLASRRFPPPRTLSARLTNVTTPDNSFIGREKELQELLGLLPQPAGRQVTLTGPGGIGKTRLASEAATRLLDLLEGGCWLVDLSEVSTLPALAHAVGAALGVPLSSREDPVRAVASILEYRKPLLLVLDGFELLVEHAPASVGVWRQRAPHARFLVTSRILLGISGEREVALAPLTLPARHALPDEVARSPAVQLFIQRAPVKPDPARAAAIVREVEGIPLAIELAAAHAGSVSPGDIASGAAFPRSDPADPTVRESLLGALEWSYRALSEWERVALRQAAVFRGGFFLEAAEEVLDLTAFPEAPPAMDATQSLRDKSLLRTIDTPFGTRFGMYRVIRDYVTRRWAEDPPASVSAVRRRHAAWAAAYSETWTKKVSGPDAAEANRRLALELENVFAAHDWALGEGKDAVTAARMILAMTGTMGSRGRYDERLRRLESSLAALRDESQLEVRLACAISSARVTGEGLSRSQALLEDAEAKARSLGRPELLAFVLQHMGYARLFSGDSTRAVELLRQAVEQARLSASDFVLERTLDSLGNAHRMRSEFDEALACFAETEALTRRVGNTSGLARALGNAAVVMKRRGEFDRAIRNLEEARRIFEELDDFRQLAVAIGNMGSLRLDLGDYEAATRDFEESEAMDRELGNRSDIALDLINRGSAYQGAGRDENALECLLEAEKITRDLELPELLAGALAISALSMSQLGRAAEALPRLDEAERLARGLGSREQLSNYLTMKGGTLLVLGRAADAVVSLREARVLQREIRMEASPRAISTLVALCRAEKAAGDPAATETARTAVEMMDRLKASRPIRMGPEFEEARRIAKG